MSCLIIIDTAQGCSTNTYLGFSSILSSLCEIATVVIAVVNVILLVRLYKKGEKADVEKEERNRRLDLFKTLFLDHQMSLFYQFFDDFSAECSKLLNDNEIGAKKEIDQNLKDQTRLFRKRFICLLSAVDENLYNDVLSTMDNMLIDPITETIFNEGINLKHEPMFEEKISNTISDSKIKILSILFHYQDKTGQ